MPRLDKKSVGEIVRASRLKKGVVIAKVEGGLGNQMFIYAAAKGLAVRNNVPLKLDVVSGYLNDVYGRQFCLDHFNIEAEIATPKESFTTNFGPKRRYWTRKMNRLLPFSHRSYIEEEKVFDKRLLGLKVIRSVYLQGYWQDERYFKDIEDIIRKDFTIATDHEEANIKLAERISGSNGVCLHARRGDYPHALPIAYYKEAIKYVTQKVQNPHFYCFSDDSSWIEQNLVVAHPSTVIRNNNEMRSYEDLWLMSKCRHFIVANSSFSWWGAWLNPDPNKVVVAPARWGYDTAIPKTWKALEY